MAYARRQHRAPTRPATAATTRGLRMAMAALYAVDTVTPEQAAAIQHALAKPRGKPVQCALALGEPDHR